LATESEDAMASALPVQPSLFLCILLSTAAEAAPEDAYEENDDFTQAFDLGSNSGVCLSSTGGPGTALDDDWYAISVTNGPLEINLVFTDAKGDIDLALHDSLGNRIALSASSSDNEHISHVISTGAGTYYLRVYPFAPSGNQYDLSWGSSVVSPPLCDPDNDAVFTFIDNCPDDYNPSQLDADTDGIGNICEDQNLCVDRNAVLQNKSYSGNHYCAAEESIIAGGLFANSVSVESTGHTVFSAPTIKLIPQFAVAIGGLFRAGSNLEDPCQGFTKASDSAQNSGGSLDYLAHSSAVAPYNLLNLYLFAPTVGSTLLTGENYATCQECLLVYTSCSTDSSCTKTFLATQGILDITSISGTLNGSLTNISLEEVTINPINFISTPVPNGERYCIPAYSFSTAITP
jgi:hypothetical protein